MTDFTMPSLGADMDEGTLLEWLVAPGDVVHKGDILAVVDTAKSAVDVESFSDGVVGALLVEPGTVVPVGTVLATLDGAAAPTRAPTPAPTPAPALVPTPARAPTPAPAHAPPVGSPLVRREAADLGVDLADVVGTGRGGAITRRDVERTASEQVAVARAAARERGARPRVTPYARRLARELGVDLAAVTAPGDRPVRAGDVRAAAAATERPTQAPTTTPATDKQQAMRHAIASLMARAKREIPHYYLATTVDLDRALRWMHERNRGLPVGERLVPAALLLKATALATARAPQLNGFWVDDAFVPGAGVHLGLATSLRGGGLVAPALHDVDTLTLAQVMSGMRDLVTRARAGRMHRAEMSDPTITVTNLGEQGVESVQGVIYPPQVALVGFGRISERPWAVDGLLGVRPLVTLTLAADHRATDGFTGGRFLADIDQQLQHPEDL